MEFRQRAPRERLDQDGPLSEERPLPKVPCWMGGRSVSGGQCPSDPAFGGSRGLGRLAPATATGPFVVLLERGPERSTLPLGVPISCYKKTPPRTKTLGSPNSAASGVPDIRLLSPPPKSRHSVYPQLPFPGAGTTVVYSKHCGPQSQSVSSTWVQLHPRSLSLLSTSRVTHHLPIRQPPTPRFYSEPQEQHFIPSLLPLTFSPNSSCPKFDSKHCNQHSFILP